MAKFLATFYTHYGAMKFNKTCQKISVASTLMTVPRKLSSSCGICVEFEAQQEDLAVLNLAEDMENCYLIKENNIYEKVVFPNE